MHQLSSLFSLLIIISDIFLRLLHSRTFSYFLDHLSVIPCKQPYHVSRLLQGYTTRRRTDWRFSYVHYDCLRKQHICTFVCTTKENYAVLQNRLYTLLCITYRPNISVPHSMSKRKHRKACAQIHKKQQ